MLHVFAKATDGSLFDMKVIEFKSIVYSLSFEATHTFDEGTYAIDEILVYRNSVLIYIHTCNKPKIVQKGDTLKLVYNVHLRVKNDVIN